MNRLFVLASIVILSPVLAVGQGVNCGLDPVCKDYKKLLDTMVADYAGTDTAAQQLDLHALRDLGQDQRTFFQALQDTIAVAAVKQQVTVNNLVSSFDHARIDKQSGSTTAANGSTNLVSLPSSSSLVSFAVQSGALTDSVNGDTATLRGNLYGIAARVDGLNPYCSLGCKGAAGFASKIDLSASMNLAASASSTVATSGTANAATPAVSMVQVPSSAMRLSSITARYAAYNPVNPHSSKFHDKLVDQIGQHTADLTTASAAVTKALLALIANGNFNDPRYAAAWDRYKDKIPADAKGNSNALVADFEAYFADYYKILSSNDTTLAADVALAQSAMGTYQQLNQDLVNLAKGVPEFTLEYTYSKPVGQPQTHDARLIFAYTPQNTGGALTGGTFTFNLAASLYGSGMPTTANYGRLKDMQVSAEWDRPIFGNLATKKATLSIAGYGQYQGDPTVLNITSANLAPGTSITLPANAQVLLGTSGWQGIGQIKLTIVTSSGASIPLAFKWANKTNLLDSNKVNGQFGISYDFSSFSQLFGASAP